MIPSVARADASRVVFYDPGANQFDVVGLTNAMNSYLGQISGDMAFQIVQDTRTLETVLKDPQVRFAWIAADYLQGHKSEGLLRPLLVPSSQGDVYFRKVLIDAGKGAMQDLRSVAATGSNNTKDRDLVATELRQMGVKNAKVVLVPKDIDAELALSFGQVDAALVTPVSIEVLRKVNPQGAAKFRMLAETKQILRSPFCTVGSRASGAETDKMQDALRNMGGLAAGQELMRRLSFDGWLPFESGMLK